MADQPMTDENRLRRAEWRPWEYMIQVELVRGCLRQDCPLQCRAQRIPIRISGRLLLRAALELGKLIAPNPTVVLYGTGDPMLWPWRRHVGYGEPERCTTTLPADTPHSELLLIRDHFANRVTLNVYTENDLSNALSAGDAGLIRGVVVPGVKGIDLRRILPIAANSFELVVVKSTSCGRDDYLTAEQFEIETGLRATMLDRCRFHPMICAAWDEGDHVAMNVADCPGRPELQEVRLRYDRGNYSKTPDVDALVDRVTKLALTCPETKKEKRWVWHT